MKASKQKKKIVHTKRRYLVMIRRTATGYSADVPDLPGCVAAAKTVSSARRLMGEAIELHLDLMSQSGESIPVPMQHLDFAVDETAEEEFCTWVEVEEPMSVTS